MTRSIFFLLLLFVVSSLQAQSPLMKSLQSFARTSAVTGREDEASAYISALFPEGVCKKDRLGNIVITIGQGSPKRLFTVPLDEPGYVVSQIQEDGYLRVTPVGRGAQGTLFHQALEGHEVRILTEHGVVRGISTLPSSHYEGMRANPESAKGPFAWQEAFIDVGEPSAKAVAAKGISLLDPLTLEKKPVIVSDHFIAAVSAGTKSAAIALAMAARTLLHAKFSGTIVIAFTTLDLINARGLASVIDRHGPFEQVIRYDRYLQGMPAVGTSVLVDRTIPDGPTDQRVVNPVRDLPQQEWSKASVYGVGLPTDHVATPVEMVSDDAVSQLARTWLRAAGVHDEPELLPAVDVSAQSTSFKAYAAESSLLGELIARYGVNPEEAPVRSFILSKLPAWAKPSVDDSGNIILHFGQGVQHLSFIAHMDEVGYMVDSIFADGRLRLSIRGGAYEWVWEAQPAILHAAGKEIPAIFEPRAGYLRSDKRDGGEPLILNAGFHSKEEALKSGVVIDRSTVTMPKKMVRLSEEKATARGFDDRVGCAALLMALQGLDPAKLPFRVTFVWSTGEEIGLLGSNYAAQSLKDVNMAYPVDTYVSSDAPMESHGFGYCPLGQGAVIRVLESINFVRRPDLKYLQALAAKNQIPAQYGMTIGGTDGQGFLSHGIPSTPLSWPGRYSHSPVEVMDFRDMQSLVRLIRAIMLDREKKYE
jgi:putative aminopeptidase FrvX